MKSYNSQWPVYGIEESDALRHVLERGQWGTLGDEAVRFAKDFAGYCGCKYGISTTSGTVSLEILVRSLGIGYGDEVIVPAYTFYSTVSSVAMTGALPVLADMDDATCNIDVNAIEMAITGKTKAVIVTHIGGRVCDMDAITKLCKKRNILLIEDAAHAHGSEWMGVRAGALADAAAFSFQASKNLTAGEGGAITTNNEDIYKEAWHYHNSGRSLDDSSTFGGTVLMGTNARMTEWQAALLNVQMSRLDDQVLTRMQNAAILSEGLKRFEFLTLLQDDPRVTRNSYHIYIVKYDGKALFGMSRKEFLQALNDRGVPASGGYNLLHRMPALHSETFRRATGRVVSYADQRFPKTEKACCEEAVWFPGSMLLGRHESIEGVLEQIAYVADRAAENRCGAKR